MASPVKRLLLVALLAAGLGFAILSYYDAPLNDQDTTIGSAPQAAAPAPAASGASAARSPDDQVASASVPAGTETVAGPGVEVAPPAEEGPLLPFLERESFGHRAGLHKTKSDVNLSASAALVIDQESGKVLLDKNVQSVLPIASLTKLMTGLVIAEANLPMDQPITITDDDVDSERHSRSRLRVGTTLTRTEALQLALMSSENRAAHALGRTYPAGLQAFVQAMNRKAQALGMKSTTYVDPTGLATGNQSSAHDLALLAAAAAKHQLLADYTTTAQHMLPLARGRTLVYNNSNRLVKSPNWDILLQKTGYIVEAGWCMLLDTQIGGHKLFVVLLDAGGAASRIGDAERIRHWAAAQFGVPARNVAPPAQPKGPRIEKHFKGHRS
ncbi:serine hydrolase [Caenimonas terrae]|uniref:Serine hydrolase n=1 Tax=Caenimonas terrae TaxID=696074 RepID=A0ABW0NB88_9BURK